MIELDRRRSIVVGALVVLVAGSGWLLKELGRNLLGPPASSRHTPDLFVESFASMTMDAQGLPHRLVEADYMAHFPDSDTNELERPYIVIYRDVGEPWHVTSERGWTSGEGDVMLLLGAVHIWRNNARGEREVDVHTRDLRVLPESDYGETEEPVVIRTPTTETRGVGMRAWLDRSRLTLLSQVRTVVDRGPPG